METLDHAVENGACESCGTVFVRIVTQPMDVTADQGETVSITLETNGEGLTYEWYYANAGSNTFSKTASFTSNSYKVSMTASRSGRRVYCVVTDSYGQSVTTDTVTLTMEIPPLTITRQPVSVTVANGESAQVDFEVEGEGLTYEWYYANAGSDTFSKTASFTSNIYKVSMTASRSGRWVYCVITDKYGASVTTDTVTLSMKTEATELVILTQLESVMAENGETAKVSVEAAGDGLRYEWYYKNADSSKFTKTGTFTGPEYTLKMNASRSGRHVYRVITDQYGNSVTTDIATLNMVSDLTLLSQPEDVTVAEGEKAVITADVVGEDLKYTWYYRNAGVTAFAKTGAFTGNTYSVGMTDSRSGRQVYCVVTDGQGNTVATDIVTLSVS